MILCIDSGNTRLKWGLTDGAHWRAQGALAQADAGRLPRLIAPSKPDSVWVANVAGPIAAARITQALADLGVVLNFVSATARATCITNGYAEPGQLGVDRWCALIAAHDLAPGAALVVSSGTAMTIDTLDERAHFQGGFILPGFDLMREALARHTAQLPLASGNWQASPQRTEDAIVSGCLEAQLGAIERAWHRIAHCPQAICLLSGGGAPLLVGKLDCPHRLVDNLVLEGLRVLSGDHQRTTVEE